jgi:hypothetical protein
MFNIVVFQNTINIHVVFYNHTLNVILTSNKYLYIYIYLCTYINIYTNICIYTYVYVYEAYNQLFMHDI